MTYVSVKGGTNAGWRKVQPRTCPECGETHWGASALCVSCKDELIKR